MEISLAHKKAKKILKENNLSDWFVGFTHYVPSDFCVAAKSHIKNKWIMFQMFFIENEEYINVLDLIYHEIAHAIVGTNEHTKEWRDKFIELGGMGESKITPNKWLAHKFESFCFECHASNCHYEANNLNELLCCGKKMFVVDNFEKNNYEYEDKAKKTRKYDESILDAFIMRLKKDFNPKSDMKSVFQLDKKIEIITKVIDAYVAYKHIGGYRIQKLENEILLTFQINKLGYIYDLVIRDRV
jgi:hypothetical protein